MRKLIDKISEELVELYHKSFGSFLYLKEESNFTLDVVRMLMS